MKLGNVKTAKQKSQKSHFISLQLKVLTGFTLVFSLVFAGAYYWFYRFATNFALEQIREDLETTMEAAASGTSTEDFAALIDQGTPRADGYSDDPRYWEHVNWLAQLESIEPRAYIYTYTASSTPNQIVFVGSGSAINRRIDGAKFLESYDEPEGGILLQGLTAEIFDAEPFTDEWGTWVSGAIPLTNGEGKRIGALGVDFRADYVLQVQQQIRGSVLIAFTTTYGTLFILVWVVSRVLTRPIVNLTQSAERIGEGDYSQSLSYLSGERQVRDEITTLAEVFEIMVGKVRQREEILKRQVAELRIEIDQTKRQKRVKEIVDTDFFQDLRVKAQSLRRRNQDFGPGATSNSGLDPTSDSSSDSDPTVQ
ncbi:HAMP domain-containing protein [Leptolyngbya sp. FACHB-671]|uniref:HAMP domain-containing protein n=1 Tax=Leptolyngbya sp. FACHB-671 TaxID=2692812 RepID=UPI001682F766|nr:HAMP domain-containing protein [Leptolyngbya sp. FACHB-671]